MIYWLSALSLGLAGSLHCLGMCGPIALALPRAPDGGRARYWVGRLLYNAGRALTYAILGAILGLVGHSIHIAGWQQGLSIACGVIILAYVIARTLGRGHSPIDAWLLRITTPVQRGLARRLGGGTPRGLFGIGLLNGLLPCGLVYVALAGAVETGGALTGALYMALFGLGTTPLMFAVALAGPSLYARWRGRFQWIIPAGLVILALLFIARGMNLGIPYISPHFSADPAAPPACCGGH